ncbi:hypothetical protein Krac_6180 [Ktedonobacter racemifer DSM 44963]|uniref:Uncharacterized protein n=1 Tax=Ktedonobacter racemifer DSM 44963 TaxID=485913 RepID=D6TY45_KTERA|nr:hypothetical protein Krac_6180 [Ktedonobacter racemifer DSM 44963]
MNPRAYESKRCLTQKEGIVNLNFSLDELSPLNLHLRPFRGLSSEKILGRCPTFLQNFWQ